MKKAILTIFSIIFLSCKNDKNKIADEKIIVKDSCALQTENILWINRFEKANNDSLKVELIKEKIKADSIYSETYPILRESDQPSAKSDSKNTKNQFCGCLIRFHFELPDEKVINANLNNNPKLFKIINKLNQKNVEQVIYVNKKDALSLYGPSAKNGVFYIYIKDKILANEITKTDI